MYKKISYLSWLIIFLLWTNVWASDKHDEKTNSTPSLLTQNSEELGKDTGNDKERVKNFFDRSTYEDFTPHPDTKLFQESEN